MGVPRQIRVLVVVAVVRGPPQRPALHRGRAQHREGELHRPRGLEGLVGEIPVVEPGDREHARRVQPHRGPEREPRKPDPEHRQAGQVQRNEGQHAQPVDTVGIAVAGGGRAGVEPEQGGAQGAAPGGRGRGGGFRHGAHVRVPAVMDR